MAVRNNIGSVGNAIEKGVKAESKIDYGPIRDVSTQGLSKLSVADFTAKPSYPNAFIMGVHQWGDLNNKVTS